MAIYDTRRALSLRQYSAGLSSPATVLREVIEVIIELAQTIEALTRQIDYLERKIIK